MGDAIDPLTNRHMSGRPAARGPAQAAWDRGNPGYAQRWNMHPQQPAPPAASSGQAQPKQSPYASSAQYGQPAVMGWPDPPQSPPAQPQGAFARLYSTPQFQDRIANSSPRMAEMHTNNLRQIAAKQDRLAGRRQYTPEENQAMMQEWQALRGTEVSTPFGSKRVGGATNEQARALMNDPASARRLAELQAWKTGGGGVAAPAQPRPPDQETIQQRPAPQQDQGARIRELLHGYNIPPGVMDQLAGLMGGGRGQQGPVSAPPVQQPFPQMPPPPPGFGQFGTPQAQQQMYQDSMMAWTMPKQNLLGWGQQAVQQPWAPNYGNMPANFRPMPYEISYNNPFGSSPMDITQNRDAFIGSILNNQANRFVGTQVGPGPVNRPAYDPSQLWQQAQGMLGGGWQNPFAAM